MITLSAIDSQTTTLNGVAATQKSGGHAPTSKLRSKPLRTTQRVGITKDSSAAGDEPVIGGLQDEDESLESAAALASPLKGSESRDLTKVDSVPIPRNPLLTLST